MPWVTPALRDVRSLVRDAVAASLPGADANVPNSVLRVLSDNQGALCHLTLQYVDWLALQLMPDTAETEWLDRHGQIWLVNADGTTGRKMATLATGFAQIQGLIDGTIVPAHTQLESGSTIPVNLAFPSANATVTFETTNDIITSATAPVTASIRALDPGAFGNLPDGTTLSISPAIPGVSSSATAQLLSGGTDTETDDELRQRILQRIQSPPMGGAQADYVAWALAVPGVTRAWANVEQGIGTMTVRFMMDDLRASNGGFPLPVDINTVASYIDKVRPVTVKDCFVAAPIKFIVDLTISNLNPNTDECKAEIQAQLADMFFRLSQPGQTMYSAWISGAIMQAPSVVFFDLVTNQDFIMPNLGTMPVLGTIYYR
jgi:uncharacterized phage protein gp47/JayE